MNLRSISFHAILASALFAGGLAFRTSAAEPGSVDRQAFEKLKSLSGEWEGQAGEAPAGSISVSYRPTSNGTAVLETLFAGTEHEMVTLYYLEQGKLVLVHYCAMGNQPKMKLNRKSSPNDLVFDFAGGSNINPRKDTHMHSAQIHFQGETVVAEWETYQAGKPGGVHKFTLNRKKA